MSLFEYVTVMISMVLALSLGQLLMGLSTLAKEKRRVVPYFPHTLWSICLLLIIVNHWWAQWDLQVINWSYGSFLYCLTGPTLLFFAVGLFVPDHGGDKAINLKDQYLDIRALFMKTMLGMFSNKPVVDTIVPSVATAALLTLMAVRFFA
jgi:hypothetical protein